MSGQTTTNFWSQSTNNSIFNTQKIEIPSSINPWAWINTYATNCTPFNSDVPVMVPNLTSHIRMSQIGILENPELQLNNDPRYECSVASDYQFLTDITNGSLILDGTYSGNSSLSFNPGYSKFTTYRKDLITHHQETYFDQDVYVQGDLDMMGAFPTYSLSTQSLSVTNGSFTNLTSSYSSLGAAGASSLSVTGTLDASAITSSSISNSGNITTNTLSVTGTPTFLNGLNIKNSALKILDNNNNVVWNFRSDGKLGIGVPDNEMTGPYWLWVKNGIMTERMKIAVKGTSDWSDKVFESGYRLRKLEDVEKFIHQNGHLPEIPSAKEVVRDGIDVQQMDAKLLQKIEELTLYVIDLQKEIRALKSGKNSKK